MSTENSTANGTDYRAWLEQHCPAAMRTPLPQEETYWGGRQGQFCSDDAKVWFEACRDRGYLAPTWPQQYGGAGLDAEQAKLLQRQMRAINARPALMSLGLHMMGPTIMQYGNEWQKQTFLPPIARGEIRWCQGYSEPGSGSDLASLSCKAERRGDSYHVNGQKVWTSYADKSDYIFCLVRTDFEASKHSGISVLLIDMQSPGITTKPIELISGSSHFCEVFLDNVEVPASHLLGEENKGWDIAKVMLNHERTMMAEMEQQGGGFHVDLAELWRQQYQAQDLNAGDAAQAQVLRAQISRHQMQRQAISLTTERVAAEIKQQGFSMAAAMMKYAMSENEKDKCELLLSLEGQQALNWHSEDPAYQRRVEFAREWAFSKIQSIGGGTSEIQLNIIAKRVLGLPD